MTDEIHAPQPFSLVSPPPGSWSRFLLAGLLLVATLGLLIRVSALAPDRIKLIGIFPLLVGAIGGFIYASFANTQGIRNTLKTRCVCGVLMAVVEAAIVLQGWMQYRSALREHFSKDPSRAWTQQLLVQGKIEDPQTREMQRAFTEAEGEAQRRREAMMSLNGYLTARLPSQWRFPGPFPPCFWGFEMIEAMVSGVVVYNLVMRDHRKVESASEIRAKISPEIHA